jgi:hypothetical protein
MNTKEVQRIAVKHVLSTETFDDYPLDNYREYIFSDSELIAFVDAILEAKDKGILK